MTFQELLAAIGIPIVTVVVLSIGLFAFFQTIILLLIRLSEQTSEITNN